MGHIRLMGQGLIKCDCHTILAVSAEKNVSVFGA